MKKTSHTYICLAALTGLIPWSFIIGLYFFGFGLWSQSEPVSASIYALCGISSLFLIYIYQRNRSEVINALFHPIVIFPVLIGLWSLISGFLFQPNPILSFFGSAESGEGLLIYIALGIMAAAIRFCLTHMQSKIRWAITASYIMAGAVIVAQTLGNRFYGYPYAPYYFPDYLVFILLPLWAVLSLKIKNNVFIIALYFIFLFLIYLTDNKAAVVLFASIPPGIALLSFLVSRKDTPLKKWFQRHTSLFIALLVILPSLFLTILIFFGSQSDIVSAINSSMRSRYFLGITAGEALIENPVKIFTGFGWGAFPDLQIKYYPRGEASLSTYAGENWEGVWRHHFHSHNAPLDLILAAGLPALLLFIIYFFHLTGSLKYDKPSIVRASFSLTFLNIWMMWFLMPLCWPFLAWASASCTQNDGVSDILKNIQARIKNIVPYFLSLISVLLLGSAIYSTLIIIQSETFEYKELSDNSECSYLISDAPLGGIYTAHIWREYVFSLKGLVGELGVPEGQKPEVSELKGNTYNRLKYFLCLEERYIQESNPTARLLLTGLLTRTDIAFHLGKHFEEGIEYRSLLDNWADKILNFMEKHPNRSDQAVPYILWQLEEGNEQAANKMIAALEFYAPEAPETYWFSGFKDLADPLRAEQGLVKMRKALDNNVESIFPIEEELKDLVLQKTEDHPK